MPLNCELMETNPNDNHGGGGSLAAEMRDADAVGPWFVWSNTEMDSGVSPYVVVAASEVDLMAAKLAEYRAGSLDALAGGERQTTPPEVAQQTSAAPSVEGEVFDFNDPEQFARAAAFARGD